MACNQAGVSVTSVIAALSKEREQAVYIVVSGRPTAPQKFPEASYALAVRVLARTIGNLLNVNRIAISACFMEIGTINIHVINWPLECCNDGKQEYGRRFSAVGNCVDFGSKWIPDFIRSPRMEQRPFIVHYGPDLSHSYPNDIVSGSGVMAAGGSLSQSMNVSCYCFCIVFSYTSRHYRPSG